MPPWLRLSVQPRSSPALSHRRRSPTGTFTLLPGRTLAVRDSHRVMGVASRRLAAEVLMRRREFITVLGGAATVWPLMARAQQAERVQRLGVLSGSAANDPDNNVRIAAFVQALQQLGWTDGQMYGMIFAGPQGTRKTIVNTRRNWPRSRHPDRHKRPRGKSANCLHFPRARGGGRNDELWRESR